MKIVIAPDSFKESLAAPEVAKAIATGFKRVVPEADYLLLPIADGGEGTLETLVAATSGKLLKTTVSGPFGKPTEASWGVLGDGSTAVIEAAEAIGLSKTDKRDAASATSFGVGELIKIALDQGLRSFVIALGGSASNDAGSGLLSALGVVLKDDQGAPLPPGGSALSHIANIDCSRIDPRIKECQFKVACDVINPLLGSEGATCRYGAQKGATPQQIVELERALGKFAALINQFTANDYSKQSGAGAAGGIAFSIAALLKGKLLNGFDLVASTVGLSEQLQGADLVITGEGEVNAQTASGKAPSGVAKLAKQHGIPVVAITGQIGPGFEAVYHQGIDALFSITPGTITLQQSLEQATVLLSNTAENIARLWLVARQRSGTLSASP